MIKNIFIPTHIGSFYVFTEKTVALKMNKVDITAAVISAHGTRRKIELLIKEPFQGDALMSYQERATAALKTVLAKVGSYTKSVLVLPSSSLIFKEITVPLMSEEKMKMVVPFEAEQLLPFPLRQAALDSIVLERASDTQKAHLLIAAGKQDVLAAQLAITTAAGISPDKVTTDILELYAFYRALPDYQSPGLSMLVLLESHTTTIGIMIDNQLKIVRTLYQGIQENSHIDEPLKKIVREIKTTLQAFNAKLPTDATRQLEKVILAGPAIESKGLVEALERELHAEIRLLPASKLLYLGATSNTNSLSNEYIIPLVAAYPLPATENFNLDQQIADTKTKKVIGHQLITAALFIALILGMLILNTFFTKRSLTHEIQTRESESINILKKEVNVTTKKGERLASVIRTAQQEVERQENIWFALSSKNRFSFLAALQELSTRLHREALGLELRQLTIHTDTETQDETMTLEGQVKNFAALAEFQEKLSQSPLFKDVPKPQDVKFNIKIVLNKAVSE